MIEVEYSSEDALAQQMTDDMDCGHDRDDCKETTADDWE